MYKLITIDIDGTLLNSYGEVSQENKNAINMALQKNIEVVLTSGRMPKAILPIANEINANKYIISGNGAAIYDVQKNQILYNNYMSKEKVLEIIDICEKNSMYYSLYTNSEILTKALNYNTLYYYAENKKNPDDKKINIKVLNDIYGYVEKYDADDFLKITICDSDEMIFKRIINKLKEIQKVDVLEVSHISRKVIEYENEEIEISYFYTEVTNENVNKWSAIEKLLDILDIKREEVIGIGDNINDKEMITNAGIGIVTGNSCPEMKKIAKEVVASNDESGVAEAVYNHIS